MKKIIRFDIAPVVFVEKQISSPTVVNKKESVLLVWLNVMAW
jgi:hypothetical protein